MVTGGGPVAGEEQHGKLNRSSVLLMVLERLVVGKTVENVVGNGSLFFV